MCLTGKKQTSSDCMLMIKLPMAMYLSVNHTTLGVGSPHTMGLVLTFNRHPLVQYPFTTSTILIKKFLQYVYKKKIKERNT